MVVRLVADAIGGFCPALGDLLRSAGVEYVCRSQQYLQTYCILGSVDRAS